MAASASGPLAAAVARIADALVTRSNSETQPCTRVFCDKALRHLIVSSAFGDDIVKMTHITVTESIFSLQIIVLKTIDARRSAQLRMRPLAPSHKITLLAAIKIFLALTSTTNSYNCIICTSVRHVQLTFIKGSHNEQGGRLRQ